MTTTVVVAWNVFGLLLFITALYVVADMLCTIWQLWLQRIEYHIECTVRTEITKHVELMMSRVGGVETPLYTQLLSFVREEA